MKHIRVARPSDIDEIKIMIDRKHACEKEMSENILNAIDNSTSQEIRGNLRALVLNSIEDIENIEAVKGGAAFEKAYKNDAKNYGFVAKNDLHNASKFREHIVDQSNIEKMDTEALGSLIRFYGEFIEAGVGQRNVREDEAIAKIYSQLKPAYRESSPDDLNKLRSDYQKSDDPNKPEWKKSGGLVKPVAKGPAVLRNRLKRSKEPLKEMDRATGLERVETDEEFKRRQAAIAIYDSKRSGVEKQLAQASGGMGIWAQEDEDLLARMNKVFGLIHGATISGTTTDALFFINRMSLVDLWTRAQEPRNETLLKAVQTYYGGNYQDSRKKGFGQPSCWGLDPLYYMIPVASIAGKGHHTILEVAIPLVLNGKMKYTINRYTTLLSEVRDQRGEDSTKIRDVLKRFENDDRNKCILVYYAPSKEIEGYVLFDKQDAAWDAVAKADQELMNKFKAFNPYPTRAQVATLHPQLQDIAVLTTREEFNRRTAVFGQSIYNRQPR